MFTLGHTDMELLGFGRGAADPSPRTYTTSSGSLSGNNTDVSIPAGAKRATVFCFAATTTNGQRVDARVLSGATGQTFRLMRDRTNGTIIEAASDAIFVNTRTTVAAGSTKGHAIVYDFLSSGTVVTFGRGKAISQDEAADESIGRQTTATVDDTIQFKVGAADTFTGGTYFILWEY